MTRFFFAFALCIFSYGYSGGIILYEIGTPEVGLASAGWAARAEDAGTAFTNPAGMTRFCEPELLVGVEPIYINIKFDPNRKTSVKGSHGKASNWIPGGGGFLVMPINENLSLGAAAVGYFGSSLNYADHWVGRYYLTRTTCMGFSFVPGAAYRVTDGLSIGVSANVMYAVDRSHCQINNVVDSLPDGRLRVTGSHWAVGGIVGVLYEASECTRFGVTYVSEVKQKFRMKPKFLDVGPKLTAALDLLGVLNSRVQILFNVPNWVMASGYHKVTPCLAVLGNVGWQQWSRFARAEITLADSNANSLTFTPKYNDTWHVALGLEYYFGCSIATCGLAYDSSIVSNKNRTPSVPLGEQWRFGVGYQYNWNPCLRVIAAYELNWTGDLKMNLNRGPLAGTVSGKYKNAYAQFFTVSTIWDF